MATKRFADGEALDAYIDTLESRLEQLEALNQPQALPATEEEAAADDTILKPEADDIDKLLNLI